MNNMTEEPSTFKSIFFPKGDAVPVRVPDYQRAYSWEQKQIELFIKDLKKYHVAETNYYFGHFIVEAKPGQREWEMVDGQQRLTTFVLFVMVCQVLSPSGDHSFAYSMIDQFSTVSYDVKALKNMRNKLGYFLDSNKHFDPKNPPSDTQIVDGFGLSESFTHSQRRMVLALLRFHQAFQKDKGELERDKITDYINVVMNALCSHHRTEDKSVAVSIFEMHNTRGVPLTTIEIIKAKLMKFVYDHGEKEDREKKVKQIQTEFGEIYGMEERLAARSFRREMTMEQLLRLHLRVVDNGTKKNATEFHSPADNANADALVAYVETKLRRVDTQRPPVHGE
jgi:hypothetical protein